MRQARDGPSCAPAPVGHNARVLDQRGSRTPEWCAATLTNRAELAVELRLPPDASHEDVVGAAFDRWGDDAPSHLRGAWAIARQDTATGDPVMWRDALGVMPAYWAVGRSGALHVGDSLARLAATGDVDASPDEEYAFAVTVHATGLLPTATSAAGIRRVPPGSSVRVPDGTPVRWWHPETTPTARRIGVEEAAAGLRDLLVTCITEATAACPPAADGPPSRVAAHLSGGMDSTLVTFVAQSALLTAGTSLDAVASWSPDPGLLPWADVDGVEDLAYDERDLVRDLADDLGVPAVFGAPRFEEAGWLAQADPATQPAETLASESHLLPALADRGIRHVLSGWGGDEFTSFNGRGTQRALVRGLRLRPLRESYQALRSGGMSPATAAWQTARPGLPVWATRARSRRPEFQQRWEREVRAAADRFPDLAVAFERSVRAAERARSAREVQLMLIDRGHLARRIESWHEAGLRFGVRYHYPLLDVRLVDWALSMPPEVFRVGRHSRRVFRLAIAGLVPDRVRTTAKDDPVLLRQVALARERRRAEHAADG